MPGAYAGPVLLLALLLASPVTVSRPRKTPEGQGIPVARLSFVETVVDQSSPGEDWGRAREGARVKTGDRLRTDAGSTARIEFPWMSLVVGPSSLLSLAPSAVLSTVLDAGRVEQRAEGGGDLIKLVTAEAQVRGGGRVVVRREGGTTLVTVLDGHFRVETAGKAITLSRGQGAVATAGKRPDAVQDLPVSPKPLSPGADPVYVKHGQAVALSWSPGGPSSHIQVLGIGSDEVLIDRDVGPPPVTIEIRWLGTFRWRVSARDERGLEGPPSSEGYICVVEK